VNPRELAQKALRLDEEMSKIRKEGFNDTLLEGALAEMVPELAHALNEALDEAHDLGVMYRCGEARIAELSEQEDAIAGAIEDRDRRIEELEGALRLKESENRRLKSNWNELCKEWNNVSGRLERWMCTAGALSEEAGSPTTEEDG
jgi:chromosome segregation ATPase